MLVDGGALSFNLSHTDGLLAVAITEGTDVGVDVERIRPISQAPSLARRYFSQAECEEIQHRGGDDDAHPETFLRLWTSRESAVKAVGCGISSGWESLRTVWAAGTQELTEVQGQLCHVQQFTSGRSHVGAVATVGASHRIRIRRTLPGLDAHARRQA